MSEPSADAGDVEAPPAQEKNPEHQLQPEGQAVEQRPPGGDDESADASPPASDRASSALAPTDGDETAEKVEQSATSAVAPGGGDEIDQEIKQLESKITGAREQKVKAESDYADLTNRLTTLRNVQKDADAAMKAYKGAYDQLRREDKAYEEYLTFEDDSLKKRLGNEGRDTVLKKIKAREETGATLKKDVSKAEEELKDAEQKRDDLKKTVKRLGDELTEWKKLAATVAAQHAVLNKMREDVIKARKAGQYGVAYWLLERAKDTRQSFTGPRLIRPATVPTALLDAVTALADAEQKYDEAERTVAARKENLAAATKERDKHVATSEAELRDDLGRITGSDAVTTGETNHA